MPIPISCFHLSGSKLSNVENEKARRLTQYIAKKSTLTTTNTNQNGTNEGNFEDKQIENEIQRFYKTTKFQPADTNILEFWKKKHDEAEYPNLFEVVKILLGASPTEVEVERLFSNISYILSPYRSRMSNKVLQAVILVRCNFNV